MTTIAEKLLIEDLADLEHQQWQSWSETICQQENISPERKERWGKYWVPYRDLSNEVQEHARVWARKVMEILERHGYRVVRCHTCNLVVSSKPTVRYTCDACIAEIQGKMDKAMDDISVEKESPVTALEHKIREAAKRLFERKYPVSCVVLSPEAAKLYPNTGGIPRITGTPGCESRVEAPEVYGNIFEPVEGF